MLDYDIVKVIRQPIIDLVQSKFNQTIQFKQGFQPITTGTNSTLTAYYYFLPNRRYGTVERSSFFDTDTQTMLYKESQIIESDIQINTIVKQVVQEDTTNLITAQDLANMISFVMQSREFLDILETNNISIYRITQIRNQSFESDNGGFEFNPSFDVTIQHNQEVISTVETVDNLELNIKGV